MRRIAIMMVVVMGWAAVAAQMPQGITVRGEGADRATVRLYDTAGRLWHEGDASALIPTSQLTAGVYLLHITSDTHTAKLTIAGH